MITDSPGLENHVTAPVPPAEDRRDAVACTTYYHRADDTLEEICEARFETEAEGRAWYEQGRRIFAIDDAEVRRREGKDGPFIVDLTIDPDGPDTDLCDTWAFDDIKGFTGKSLEEWRKEAWENG